MQWRFWQKPGPQELPAMVKNVLLTQFNLASPSVDRMRFLEQPGRVGDRQVRQMRIFDPELISGGAAAKAKYHDFQLQSSGDRKALVFEGHIGGDGKVVLSDRRPITDFKSSESPTGAGAIATPTQAHLNWFWIAPSPITTRNGEGAMSRFLLHQCGTDRRDSK